MDKTKELARNTVIITIGKISTQFLSFLLLPLYTALLTTQQYGTADLYINYIYLLVPVLTLQLDMGLFRFLIDARQDEENLRVTMASAFACVAAQSLACALLYILLSFFMASVDLTYLFFNVVIASWVALAQQAARGVGDNISFAVSGLISALIQIGMNLLLICRFGWHTEALYLAFFCGNLGCGLFLFFHKKMYLYLRFADVSWKKIKELLAYCVPLVPNAMCWWGVNAADRTIVAVVLGKSANGLLAISHKFSALYATGISIFVYPWTESASMHYAEPDRDAFFSSVIHTMFRLFLAACIVMIAGIPLVFALVVDAQFGDAYRQIPIFMVASLLNTVVGLYSVVFQAAKKTQFVAVTSIIAAGISIAVDFALIRWLGLYAPAIASFVAYGAFAVIRYRAAQKYMQVPLEGNVIASGVAVLAAVLAAYYSGSKGCYLLGLLAATGYAGLINRDFLKSNLTAVGNRLRRKR